jgi:hypothetical protein
MFNSATTSFREVLTMGKKRFRRKAMKPRCQDVLRRQDEIRAAAEKAGLLMRLSFPTWRGKHSQRATVHMRFDCRITGQRILDFWPATGTTMISGVRGWAGSPEEALLMAARELSLQLPMF